ncbi:MAG: hypothetical protein IJU60_01160 [Acholeplasmatales bacterium]|nr:hypothetical protein [Acholeplasmatales bacterium]
MRGKLRKSIIFLICFAVIGFGLAISNNIYAEETSQVANNETSKLLVNESTTITVATATEVYVNDELLEGDKILTETGKYDVKYVNINQVISKDENGDDILDENDNPVFEDVITESTKTYYIVNLSFEEDEVYANELELNLEEVSGVTYLLNGEEVSGDVFATTEGVNTLTIKTALEEKSYSFEIFKLTNKKELNGKRFTTIPTVEYTLGTSALVYVNDKLYDGSITKIGNYHFEAKNTKGVVIDELEFTVAATVRINGIEYKDIEYTELEIKTLGYSINNSGVSLKSNTNNYAKIEYNLECSKATLSNNDIYSGYTTYNPGLNTLVLNGEGSYFLTITFKNNPTTNIISNHKYNSEVLPIISGGKMIINGYEFSQGSTIKTSGLYEMVIKGLETESVATYKFEVAEEEMNITSSSFDRAVIPAKTNNYMTINGTKYNSGDVISEAGEYKFGIYYPTYNASDNVEGAKELLDSFIKSKYVAYKEYTFKINKGINIENNKEYYDSKQILFSGVDEIELTFEGVTTTITESGYLANKIGDYKVVFDGTTYNFSITPSLLVFENQVYFNNVVVLNDYDFVNGVNFTLECENGTTESNKSEYTNSAILKKSLGVGSYKLTITTLFGYKKEVSFIVISSNVVNRGAAYNNGKSFSFNMYGVKAYLNAPETSTRNRSTALYQNEKIKSVGKHYFIFEFNGISTTDDDTAVFFYIRPIVTKDGEATTETTLKGDFEAELTFKDGNGEDIENDIYKPLYLDANSRASQMEKDNSIYTFDEIGNHYIDIKLDGYSYRINLTINSYFYTDEIKDENKVESASAETYLNTPNVYESEVTFVNVLNDNLAGYKLDDKDEVNGIKITSIGNHKLYLYGTNNYKKVLVFVVKERVELSTKEELLPQASYDTYTYNTSILIKIFGNGEFLLDTNTYESESLIDKVGNHLLVIKGANGYTKNYRFRITESLKVNYKGVKSNELLTSYDEAFDFGINYDKCATCKLNGAQVDSNITSIDTIGKYTLKITGTNDYVSTYSFKVLPTLSFVSNESVSGTPLTSYKQEVTPTLDNSKGLKYQSVTLNGNAYNFETLDTVNTYKLILEGVCEYKKEYTFSIKESLLYSFDNNTYTNVLNRVEPKDNNVGKKVYIKKEFSNINYLNSKLNGVSVSDNELSDFVIVDTLGDNKLVINDVTYEIKLREINTNLYLTEADATTNKVDQIEEIIFSDELVKDIKLDNVSYDNSTISSFGLHKVLISGVNYTNTYYFYINLDTNIINDNDYYTNVDIVSNAKEVVVLANTTKINGVLDTVGTYKVTFNGLYNYKETYTINLKSKLICNNELLTTLNTANLINIEYEANTNHYKNITLNGNNYSLETINTIGNNKLVLFDINNNETKYTLTINSNNYINSTVYENKETAQNNEVNNFVLNVNTDYLGSVKLDNKNAQLTLANNQYGLHMISIVGVNGYQADYYFDIKLESNLEATTYELEKVIEMNAYFEVDSNVLSKVTEVGNHKAVISKYNIDSFEYEEVEFVITEKVSGFELVNNSVVTPVIEGNVSGVMLSNVTNYQAGDKVTKAGKYTLKVTGSNGYTNSYDFEIKPVISFENYDFNSLVNTKEVNIISNDSELSFEVYVNDVLFDTNKSIDTIGNNKVEIKGFDYSNSYIITLNEVTNITSSSYKASDSFIPLVTNLHTKSVLVDGNEYDLLPITFFGNHVCKVVGVNGYEVSYTFDIELDTNLMNDSEYLKNINVVANADIYINNIKTNKSSFVGYNEVTFKGLNKEATYNVLIKELVEGFNNDKYLANALINISNISSITLDGKIKESVDGNVTLNVSEVGNHSFIINGLNDYHSVSYTFTVIEDLPLLENNNTFTNEIIINVDNVKSLLLNGLPFTSGDKVSLIGTYTLEVIGINDYSNEYHFQITYAISGIENDGVYVGHAQATATNVVMMLDGEAYNSGDVITIVGYHKLVVSGDGSENTYIYDFVILPDLSQNEIINDYELNNVVINDPKSFYVDSASKLEMLLNGSVYDGGLITKAGIYKLELIGSNGYKKEFNFTFDVEVEEIKSSYTNPITPAISSSLECEILLNDNNYQNNTLIDEAGNYKLTIKGVNGYKKEYEFALDVEVGEIKPLYNNVFTPAISKALKSNITLNDLPYQNGNKIEETGNYKLVISGVNGYKKEYEFSLEPTIGEIKPVYTEAFTPVISLDLKCDLLLNGNNYQNNTLINKVGNYKLEINGNNYHKEYEFVVKENLSYKYNGDTKPLINNLVLDDYIEIINNNTLEFSSTLNNEDVNNLNIINDLGNNVIVINGVGGYVSTYEIKLVEKLNFVNKNRYEEKDLFVPALTNNLQAEVLVDGNLNDTLKGFGKHLIKINGINGYTSDYELYVELDTNITNKATYNKSVTINMNSIFTVDGIECNADYLLDIVGNHTIKAQGLNGEEKTFDILVSEYVEGLENNKVYDDFVLPKIDNAELLLNNEAYTSNTKITNVGNYVLDVIGTNGYKNSYEFVIKNNEFEYDGKTLENDVLIDIPNAKLVLDGEELANNSRINTVGIHYLDVVGVNEYKKSYTFTIKNVEFENDLVTDQNVVINIPNAKLYVDSKEIENGTSIEAVGNHKLVVKGTNGYEKSYEFVIKNVDFEDNLSTYDTVLIDIPNAKLVLDNAEIENNSRISEVGIHYLDVNGENDYLKSYMFTIKNTEFENNLKTINPVTINIPNSKLYVDNVEIENNSVIKSVGNHTLKVEGTNGYVKTYEFVIENVLFTDNLSTYDTVLIDIPNAKLVLDNTIIDNNSRISEVGIHYLDVYGDNDYKKSYVFTIKNTEFENNLVTDQNVLISIPNAKLYVDNEEVENNSYISLVGNHKLTVKGTNGYEKSYQFVIENIPFENNQVIKSDILINIPNAKLYLDGEEIENNSIIKAVGNHILEVKGTNDYARTYEFVILNKEFEDTTVEGSISIDIPYAKLYVDGKEIDNNSVINEIGNHELEVKGTNNYIKKYKFTITPDKTITQNENSDGYVANIEVANVYKDVKIDNLTYENGSDYKSVGNHTLTIYGTNGYVYTEDFTVEALTKVSDTGVYKDKLIIKSLDAEEMILDGKELTKDKVISNGDHILVIKGANGYEKVIKFTYDNPNDLYVIIYTIVLATVFLTSYVCLIIYKNKKKGKEEK